MRFTPRLYVVRGGEAHLQLIRDSERYIFRLFIGGGDLRSVTAITAMRSICLTLAQGSYKLEIVDVNERPDLAEREAILETPTLIREQPLPRRRVVGDLSENLQLLRALELGPFCRFTKPAPGDVACP